MKKLIALVLTLSMLLSVFGTLPVMAENGREEILNARNYTYLDVEYNRDIFVTYAELIDNARFSNSINAVPNLDDEGQPLDPTEWYQRKGWIGTSASGKVDYVGPNLNVLLIDSIDGVEGGYVTERSRKPVKVNGVYVSSSEEGDAAFNTYSRKLYINGNSAFELDTTADNSDAKHYFYNAPNTRFKLGPIGGTGAHRTATGTYNIKIGNQKDWSVDMATNYGADTKNLKSLSAIYYNGAFNNGYTTKFGTSLAALKKITIKYKDAAGNTSTEVKYAIMTRTDGTTGEYERETESDADRLGKVIVYIPKYDENGNEIVFTTGNELSALSPKILTEKNSASVIGKAITLEDVVFPNQKQFILGESVPFVDSVIGRMAEAGNSRQWCPGAYLDNIEIPFDADKTVVSVTFNDSAFSAQKEPKDENGNSIYLEDVSADRTAGNGSGYYEVTIPGASDQYRYFAKFARNCTPNSGLFALTLNDYTHAEKIAVINEKIETAETTEELEAVEAEIAEYVAENPVVLTTDFNISVIAGKKAELERVEALNAKNSTRVDIVATAKAPATGYSAHKMDAFKNPETYGAHDAAGTIFYEGVKTSSLRPLMNVFYLGYSAPSYFTKDTAFDAVHTFDISKKGYEVAATGTATGTRAVKGADGTWAIGAEETYQTKYYNVPGENGNYIVGPVAVEDTDTATDVFLSLNSILLGRKVKDDRTGTSNESTNTNVFENINLSGDFLNIMMYTFTHEGDATLVPIKVTYTTGNPETYYAFTTKISYDDRRLGNMVYYLPKKADGSEYTQAEVVAATKEKLTTANAKTIGVDANATIRDISFVKQGANKTIIIPKKFKLGTYYNRNTGGNSNTNDYYVDDITIPLDPTRTVSSVTFTNWVGAADIDKIVDSHNGDNGNTDYKKVTINGYEGDYDFFVYFGRTCQGRSALFGMSVTNLSNKDKIEKINAQLESAVTKDEVTTALTATADLINGSNGAVLLKDFDADAFKAAEEKLVGFVLADIEAAETKAEVEEINEAIDGYVTAFGIDATALRAATAAKIAEFDRIDALDDRDEYYYPIEYNLDAFATFAEIVEFGAFEAKVDGAYVLPEKDLSGNPLDTVNGNWFSKKGLSYSAPGTIHKRNYMFLIESIDGTNKNVTAQAYTSPTDYTIKNVTRYVSSFNINGNPNFELQTMDEDGTRHYKYNAGNVMYKMGPIGGTGAHHTADGGYNMLKINSGAKYTFERVQENAEKLSFMLAYSQPGDSNNQYASLEKVTVEYNDGRKEDKYIVIANMNTDATSWALTSPGDRLGRVIVAVPKEKDGAAINHGSLSELEKNFVILAETNDVDIAGVDITLEDVIFPGDIEVVIGESMPIADRVINSNSAATNGDRYGPDAYANHYTLDFGADVKSITYKRGDNFAKEHANNLFKTQNTSYIPVTIPGANEDYVYYARFGRPCSWSVALMGATSYEESLLVQIAQAEEELAKVTANTSMEDAAYAEELLAKIVATGKVKESDFDAEILATFKATALAIKEKANVSGTIEMTYVAGTKPVASVTIKNLSALAGKPYKVIIACYDENDNLLGTTVKDCVSTTEKASTFTVEAKNLPDGTAKVKGFLWKDFGSLMPLAASDEAAPSSYALDRFFNTETGEYIYDESGELNVVFIGDSLTQGASTYDGDALSGSEKLHWTNVICEYFAEKTGKRVNLYNAGVGGTQTSFVAKMVSQTAEDKNADIVFIENVNDLNTNTTNSQKWTENLVRSLAKLDKKPVVILAHAISPFQERDTNGDSVKTVAEGKEWQIQHANAKDVVAKAYNLASVDYVSYYYENTNGFDTNSDWMQEDYGPSKIADKNVHPLTAGYTRFGRYIVSQIDANPSAYLTRIKPAEDVAVMHTDVADNNYVLTYPTSSRFTYKGFNLYTKANKLTGYTTKDAEYLIDWKYNFPHGGAAQALTDAEFEFTTEANYIEIVHSSPYLANTRADFDIYVDGNLYLENKTTNAYANVLNTTSVEISGEGLHKVKVVVKPTAEKKVFNFAYLVEQK